MRYLVWLLLVGVLSVGYGQEGKGIYLHNQVISPPSIQRNTLTNFWPQNNCDEQGNCFGIVQFEILPTAERKAQLEELGIILLQYLPHNAYLASYSGPANEPLPEDVLQALELEGQHKRPNGSLSGEEGEENNTHYSLVGLPFPGITPISLAQALEERGALIDGVGERLVNYRIPIDELNEGLSCPLLQYTEAAPIAPIPEGRIGRASSRIIHPATGLPFTGEGIAIAIGDDGSVNHLDFQGRLIDHTQFNTGAHAEMVCGMAIGGGNIDAGTKGSAPGANVHLFNLSNYTHINQAVLHFEDFGTAITSTSFGEGCGEIYQISTRDIDAQVFANPQLLHVFSAGNHGNDPCGNPYSFLGPDANEKYYATITGGRKAGKNVLAIGNINWNDQLLNSSSIGPTPDGRLKPDLCALGNSDYTTGPENSYQNAGGTSASAPNVAGALAILYQAYRETHNNNYPSSALIKALILNTTDDLGVAGPDFYHGWGRLNTRKALASLQADNYQSFTISHQQQQTLPLAIPNGAQRVKVMLYWHDPAGSPLSSRSLVNDLDLRLQLPNGQYRRPWMPSSVPHLDSLGRPALPGIDRLNNMEQVVIDQPTPGTYNLVVDGYQIPQGTQQYYLVYEVEMAPIELLSPQTGETYVPGEQSVITWDAITNGQSFGLDVSYNNGQSWSTIVNNLAPSTRSYVWPVPNQTSSQVRFRLRRSGSNSISAQRGTIAPLPVFSTVYEDANTVRVSWEPIAGAASYRVYRMGEQEMEALGSTPGTSYNLPATVGYDYWYSVAPVFANGQTGRRAIAQNYEHYGCETEVTLALQFDLYPEETAWYILDALGAVRASGGPYFNVQPNAYREEVVCLPPGCFTLVMTDAYSNGMCCNNGNGFYQLTNAYGELLLSGGEFLGFSYEVFCVDDNGPLPLQVTTTIVNPVECSGSSTGTIHVTATGGNGNYTYAWNTGSQQSSIGNLNAATYAVTVSDGNQTIARNVTLTEPTPIQINYNVTPANCEAGSIFLTVNGGTPPYDITWSDGGTGAFRTGLSAGNYYAVIFDANNCLRTANITVTGGVPLTLHLTSTYPTCQAANGGTITANVSGGNGNYTYAWSTGQTGTNTIGGLFAGTYQVTVTDDGCSTSATAQLAAPLGFQTTASTSNPSCFGEQNGWIALELSGGTAPFNYFWSDGNNSSIRTDLDDGAYSVTVTDAGGCISFRNFTLTDPTEVQVVVNTVAATSPSNGAIYLAVNGGTGPYTILWNTGHQGLQLNNLAPGSYIAQIIDQNGCQSTVTAIVDDEIVDNPNLEYCESQGANTNYEWIEQVTINGLAYESGNDFGFGDYVTTIIPLQRGKVQQVMLHPGYTSTNYNEHWKVWIDFNHDGDYFDPGEEVVSIGPQTGVLNTQFTTPSNVQGSTQMRIAMGYGSPPAICDIVDYGEVEDYTIQWVEEIGQGNSNLQFAPSLVTSTATTIRNWTIYPNPAATETLLRGWSPTAEEIELVLMDANGRTLRREKHQVLAGPFQHLLVLDKLPPGNYQVLLIGREWRETLRLFKH